MFLRPILGCLFLVVFLTGLSACANTAAEADSKKLAPPRGPGFFVTDRKCADVTRALRDKLKKTSTLGLEAEVRLARGTKFIMPWREDGGRRWQAFVTAICFKGDNLTTRIDVEVLAQRQRPDGSWIKTSRTHNLKKKVINAIYPLP